MITRVEDVTPEWLTSILHRVGIANETTVRSHGLLQSRELQVSTVHRLSIDYQDNSARAVRPRSLFLKLCAPRAHQQKNIARNEVEFYRTLAPGMSCPPLIRCYDTGFSEETGQSHILLEDLSETHSQPEQNTSPSEKLSRMAVQALAAVHARWWDSSSYSRRAADGATLGPESARQHFLSNAASSFDGEWLRRFVEDLEKSFQQFAAVAKLTPKQQNTYRAMLDAAPQIWGQLLRTKNLTVTHGDLHWWNFLYPKDGKGESVRVFDWHLWHIDLGARDLAFLVALGGFSDPRPEIETDLLRVYHEALRVPDYSWEMLYDDYRWSAIRNLNLPIIFWSQGKHESTWRTTLRRALDAHERLECDELIRR